MIKRSFSIAALGVTAGMTLGAAAIAQTPTSPDPTMSNNPGASAQTAGSPGMSSGNDVMATPASPDSSMSKGTTGRKHMKHHTGSTTTPPAEDGTMSNTMGNTTAPQ